jgi:hypothetical protein
MVAKILRCQFMELLKPLLQSLGASVPMIFAVMLLKSVFVPGDVAQFSFLVVVSGLIYCSALVFSDRWFDNQVALLLKQAWKSR